MSPVASYSLLRVLPLALAVLLGAELTAAAFFGPFKRDREASVPEGAEAERQVAEAEGLLSAARADQSAGREGTARSTYRRIVRDYPSSGAAAEAQFALAEGHVRDGKLIDAYEAYAVFLRRYRQSPRYSQALEGLYQVAEAAKSGQKVPGMIGLSRKVPAKDIAAMYGAVVDNAPFSEFAPKAQFSIGEVYQEDNNSLLAVAAFEDLLDNYPDSPEASEARLRIATIETTRGMRTYDPAALETARRVVEESVAREVDPVRRAELEELATRRLDPELAARSMEIAEFYEKRGNPRAAAIYYREVLDLTGDGGDIQQRAEGRLLAIGDASPEALELPQVEGSSQREVDPLLLARNDVRLSEDYAGPPSPEMERLRDSLRPRLPGGGGIPGPLPIPVQEPDLPMPSGVGDPGGLLVPLPPEPSDILLPPVDGGEGVPSLPGLPRAEGVGDPLGEMVRERVEEAVREGGEALGVDEQKLGDIEERAGEAAEDAVETLREQMAEDGVEGVEREVERLLEEGESQLEEAGISTEEALRRAREAAERALGSGGADGEDGNEDEAEAAPVRPEDGDGSEVE
jgi:outer membrane protein assembly factor BamD (BamD/ComL family)